MANISNPSSSGSGGGGGNGSSSGSGSCPDIGSNEDDVDFSMHADIESEFEEKITDNEMLYAINEEDSDDSNVELVQAEWQI